MSRSCTAPAPAAPPAGFLSQVRWNCHVASAGQSGLYSLCGVLLRLRQLYKWEQGLAPWTEPEPAAVLGWIEDKERAWDDLQGRPFRPLAWEAASFDPFAVEELNVQLLPRGLAYGAGLTRGLAPTFFLGELLETRQAGGVTVLVLGSELARDLDASPALCQGKLIYARRAALAFYLWDRLADPGQQSNAFLHLALAEYRLKLRDLLQDPEAHRDRFDALVAGELEAVIHHEMGEVLEPGMAAALPVLCERYPQTRIELWVRAVKDCLAEVNDWGRVSYLIRERRLASLALMLAWRPGLYPLLLPELEPAFQKLLAAGDWRPLEEARAGALTRLRRLAQGLNDLLASHECSPSLLLRAEIERRYLAPLGL